MPSREFPSREPATRVGGQRRRSSRPSHSGAALPRSRTLPVLAAGGGEPEGADAEPELQEGVTAFRYEETANVEASQSMANFFYPPIGSIAVDLSARDNSPTPTSGSGVSTAATDGKKKHGLTLSNPFHKQPSLMQMSLSETPLPPETPTKAAKFLGYGPEISRDDQVDGDVPDAVDEQRVHFNSDQPHQHSVPVPVAPGAKRPRKIFDHIETDDEDEPPKPKSFWGSSKKTAKKIIAMVEPDHTDVEGRPPRQRSHPKTVNKHIVQKELIDKMAPITEASYDNMRAAYRSGEGNHELDVIEEYTDHFYPHRNLVAPERVESLTAPTACGLFELDGNEVSPVLDGSERHFQPAEKWGKYDGLPGTPVENKKPRPMAVHCRSPLQVVEDRFLDVAEKELEANKYIKAGGEELPKEEVHSTPSMPVELSKAKQLPTINHLEIELELEKALKACDVNDANRKAMDAQVAAMKAKHEKFKKDFEPYLARAEGREVVEDDEPVSIRSSIDLDEEPTLHVATAMTFTRITPGMVKLVDIPPRKNKNKKQDVSENEKKE